MYPGQTFAFQVPREFQSFSYINVSPRRTQTNPWVDCKNYKIDKNGDIALENVTDAVVRLVKGDHFADMRDCTEISCEDLHSSAYVMKIYNTNSEDTSHLVPGNVSDADYAFLDQVVLDPDNQLSQRWKLKFKTVCEEYSDIINPRPGKYNGYYGRVDHSINFSSVPPSNSSCSLAELFP